MLKPKVSIIGAGNVGIRYAYALMLSGLARSIVILDLDRQRAQGEVLDLASGMPYVSPVEIKAGDYSDLKGSDIVVITAGRKQQPNQTRLALTQANTQIFKTIVPKIMRYAKEAIWLVVSNPVDILSYAAYKISGKPWQQVIGSGTVLDSARFRFLLSRHCNIDARNIHAYILGEHGDTEFPVWSTAMIGQEETGRIFEEARSFAYKIIERKGETSYGIGLALVRISEAILKDENSILPVSCLLQGYYGISDAYMSLPAVVNKNGVREILPIKLNNQEAAFLKQSAQTLKSVIKDIDL